MAQLVKNLPAMQEAWGQSLGQEDPLEKGTATQSSILWPGEFHGLSLSFLLKGGAHRCPGSQGLWPQDQAPPPLHPLNQVPCHESPSGPVP